MKPFLFFLLALLFQCVMGGKNVACANSINTPSFAELSYGPHQRNVMDVWLAKGDGPRPCVMYIHGGGWLQGDKKTVSGLKYYLLEGISVVSINYRYVQQKIVDSGSSRGKGPLLERWAVKVPPVQGSLEDVARALQYIRHRAQDWNIDPKKVAVTGPSAGGCSALWLNFHDDMADPNSDDPVKRESTKPYCAASLQGQTSLDPKQILEWTPNNTYGGHAFGFIWDSSDHTVEIRSFLKQREDVMDWIKEYSPYELVTKDDPPVYLSYESDIPSKGKVQKDPVHSSNYGALLAQRLEKLGLEHEFVHKGTKNPRFHNVTEYLAFSLKYGLPTTQEDARQFYDGPKEKLHLYLLIGQSNMAGRAPFTLEQSAPLERCYLFNEKGNWEVAKNPLNRYSSVRKTLNHQKMGPGYQFSKWMLEKHSDINIGLIVNARGGLRIQEWEKGERYYQETLERTRTAQKTGVLKGILWHQGESNKKFPEKYLEQLQLLVKNLREDLGIEDLPFVAGQVHELPSINEQIDQLPLKVANTSVVSSKDLMTMDRWHFDSPSAIELGRRYAQKMFDLQKSTSKSPSVD